MEESREAQHGIESAMYRNNGISFRPYIDCLCGWSSGSRSSWSSAGNSFDQHLKEVRN